jgi:uncharacterized protein YbaA (DUF1428 family)
MKYVDGYVLSVPKKNLPVYRRMAEEAGKVWREHGALEFRECVGDDLKTKKIKSFPSMVKPKPGETVVSPGSYSNRERIAMPLTPRS